MVKNTISCLLVYVIISRYSTRKRESSLCCIYRQLSGIPRCGVFLHGCRKNLLLPLKMIIMTKCGAMVNAYRRDSYHAKADIKEGGGGFNLQSPHAVRK